MSHKWEETGHFWPLRHEEVATWAPWRQRSLQVIRRSPFGRHLVAMATESLQKNQVGRHLGLPWRPPLQVATSFKQGKVATYGRHGDLDVASGDPFTLCRVATYGRHGDLEVQVATSTPFAHGRHLLDGEKDDFHGDLLI